MGRLGDSSTEAKTKIGVIFCCAGGGFETLCSLPRDQTGQSKDYEPTHDASKDISEI